MVHVVAYFGFTATGSSDDGREWHITTAISPTYAQQILRLQEAGATEEELHPVVAQAATESKFTDADVLLIGDTPADVTAGRTAGVRVLGVATGRTTTAELDKAGATVTVTGLEDLQPLRALLRQ
ncbi:Phosphoglycolate phosphatase [Streptomyces sp. IB2014 011-1]|nr:Phosphoglycolate phosphatase [Streptomyces sp. IB2014 011-1]